MKYRGDAQVPTYCFHLKTGSDGTIVDTDGTDLPDDRSAREHAEAIARELMAHREPRTRSWRLDVRDNDGLPCFDLLFARFDDTLSHLTPDLRASLENLCASSASFAEAIHAMKLTLLDIKATIARAEGALYLAAVNGAAVRSRTDQKPRPVLVRENTGPDSGFRA